ncbi:MAG TPA: BamA/TamA family outer membrane protein [Williamwhitmania sp.]|nr:BamA/TamA family outer membrane protein [Williamwhitmania sp.]
MPKYVSCQRSKLRPRVKPFRQPLLYILWTIAAATLSQPTKAQQADSTYNRVKTGWTLGALPIIAYDSDLGVEYGGLVNFYYYGDGKTYPNYHHSLYAEVSHYTKGNDIKRLFFDSPNLLPGIRLTSDMSYSVNRATDFFGFNGDEAIYKRNWTTNATGNPDYKTSAFYEYCRKISYFSTDIQGDIVGRVFRWAAGISLFNFTTGPVNLHHLNENSNGSSHQPPIPTLYDRYVEWGIIKGDEKHGGFNTYARIGAIYDTRDNEANPQHGICSKFILNIALPEFGNEQYEHVNLSITHEQYFTLIRNMLTFAYRLALQTKLMGHIPFYLKPNLATLYLRKPSFEGLGGAQTLRGILRNRIVGDGVAYGNFELRWKAIRTIIWRQNVYIALSAFTDMGQVIQKVVFDRENAIRIATQQDPTFKASNFFADTNDHLHVSYGCGLHIALNENFIFGMDYGRATSPQDGLQGIYSTMSFLF